MLVLLLAALLLADVAAAADAPDRAATDSLAAARYGERFALANVEAWSGRPGRAIPLYDALLAENPGDLPTLRGRAFALLWAGREEEALIAFRSVLSMSPSDAAVRAKADSLRLRLSPDRETGSEYFRDSSGESGLSWSATARLPETGARRVELAVGFERLEDRSGRLDGSVVAARMRQILSGGAAVSGEIGALAIHDRSARPRAEVRLKSRPLSRLSSDLRVSYRDRGGDLRSLRAWRAGTDGIEASLSGYRTITASGGMYGRARGTWLDDGNRSWKADLALDHSLPARFWIAVWAEGADFHRPSVLYYAPEREWTLAGRLAHRLQVGRAVSGEISGYGGRIGNRHGVGTARGGSLSMDVLAGRGLTIRASAQYGETLRESRYNWRLVGLAVEWRP